MADRRRVILHMGFHKTGSSALQVFFSSQVHTLHDSRPEAFSDGVFWATDESATACSEAMAQLVQACSEPRL